jgi:DNA-directed RNA polymerase subunit RPC12/RpoP
MPNLSETPADAKKVRCPRCGSNTVYRSRRRGVIERHLFSAISLRPYRCENCDSRFYLRRMTAQTAGRSELLTK